MAATFHPLLYNIAALALLGLSVTACTSEPEEPDALGEVRLELAPMPVKQLAFSWQAVAGADEYQLLGRADPNSAFVELGELTTEIAATLSVALHRQASASYMLRACNAIECRESDPVAAGDALTAAVGYIKPAGVGSRARFGTSIALSADGSVLAVGASGGDSDSETGTVHVFGHDGQGQWQELAEIEASNAGTGDRFGQVIALDHAGLTLAVGAPEEDGGEDGTSAKSDSGAAYVFTRDPETDVWTEQAYIKAPNYDVTNLKINDLFGASVAVDAAGESLAIGANKEGSQAGSGAVYVYARDQDGWELDRALKAPFPDENDDFGLYVDFDAAGETLAIGAPHEDSATTEIDGDASDDSAASSGAVYVFSRSRDEDRLWQWADAPVYIKAANAESGDEFGRVSLRADGHTLAVGAPRPDGPGSAYFFARDDEGVWTQTLELVDPSPDGSRDEFGDALTLSGDGRMLVVGAPEDDSQAVGIEGDATNIDAFKSGAVWVYVGDGSWTSPPSEPVYVKASNTDNDDEFGRSVALGVDGNTLAVGAIGEDGNGSDPSNGSASNAGAVYLY